MGQIKRLSLFFTYFGGKWRIAKHYPQPQHKTLIEPFAGSAGYSLHYPQKNVLLFDRDPIICSTWDYLIRVKESEILSLPLKITDVREMPLCQEAKWLIGFWLNKGSVSPCNIPGKWMRDGWRPNSFWGEVIRHRIASQIAQIRHWKVKNLSYDQIDNQEASWFIDAPYQMSVVRYRLNKIDFDNLAEWCRTRLGQVIVCEQDGASWLPFSPFHTVRAPGGRKGAKQTKEVIWLNP